MKTVRAPRIGTRRRSGDTDGQALVEFSLILPLLTILLFGIIQFGFLLGGQIGLTNAVREAARYASTVPVTTQANGGSCSSGVGQTVYTQLLGALSRNIPGYASSRVIVCGGTPAAKATVVSYCTRANPGSTRSVWVQIRTSYKHPLFVPIVGNIVDGLDGSNDAALLATASEQMRVETTTLDASALGGLSPCP